MSKKSKVVEHVWAALQPSLAANGFGRLVGAHAYRDHESTVDVVKVEFFDSSSHRVWGTSTHSFGVTCGVFLRFAPNPFGGHVARDPGGSIEPDGNICAIRTNLLRVMRQPTNVPENVWSIATDLSNLGLACIDVKKVFEAHAIMWFQRFKTIGEIAAFLRDADEQLDGDDTCFGFGRKGSPVRSLYLGFAAAAAGDAQVGRDALVASMSKGGFAQLSGSTVVDEMIRRKLVELLT